MRVLLVAPDVTGFDRHITPQKSQTSMERLDVWRDIEAITGMHRVKVLSGHVTAASVYAACRGETRDVIHFATHSNEEVVQLSDGETLDAEDVAQIARMSRARLVFFNSCRSAKLAAFAVGHGVPYAIATTIDLPDKDAWKTALSFYEYLREQMEMHQDPAMVDIPAAFRLAVNGDGAYMLLISIPRLTEITRLVSDFKSWRADQTASLAKFGQAQEQVQKNLRLLFRGLLVLAAFFVITIGLLGLHVFEYELTWIIITPTPKDIPPSMNDPGWYLGEPTPVPVTPTQKQIPFEPWLLEEDP